MGIVNENDVEWQMGNNGDFCYARKQLGLPAGGKMLGTSLFKIAPGKKAFPYHFHYANEEAIYILEGTGTLRLQNKQLPVKKGDYIAMLKGPENAHQLVNTSTEDLLYLCFSTMVHPDVTEYPDSKKLASRPE